MQTIPLLLALVQAALPAPSAADRPGSPGDPERGIALLRTRPYQGFGTTAEEFDRLWTVWPRELRRAAEARTPAERRRLALDRYGLPLDPSRGTDVPVAFAETEDGAWSLNCLACHGGDVAGRYVPGLGNSRFAFQTFVRDVLQLRKKDRGNFSEQDKGMALTTLNASDGTTNAQVFAAVLLAFRTPDLDRSEQPRKPEGIFEHDLDAPPFWNVKHKARLYCDGYVAKDPRVIMQFALALENSGATIRGFEDDFRHVLAWIESIEPPAWPHAIDAPLAERGKAVFARSCARCHGTYEGEPTYPEKRIAVDEVGTDALRLTALPRSFKVALGESWLARGGETSVELDTNGYVAPPLHGLWASAPYFHNGSVPTLWHVLHPDERPAAWSRTPTGYDVERVGLEVVERAAPPELKRADERRRWFDTTYPGKSAAGHDFPARLSEEERQALLEYLKTL